MATAAKSTVVLFDKYNLSTYLNEASVDQESAMLDSTTFGDSSTEFTAGLDASSISLGGLYDGAATAVYEVLEAALGAAANKPLSIIWGGNTQGNRAHLGTVREASYNVAGSVADLVTISAEMQGDGDHWGGILLEALASKTSTADGTSVDQAASSSNGAVGQLHVTAFNATSIVVKIQDSADNSTWADLITFATATALTAEQLSVTGTVDRYVRVTWTLTGTSASIAVTFARK